MLIELLGRILAILPEWVAAGLAWAIGWVISLTPRGAVVRENLRRALDITDEKKLSRLTVEACERTIELGMLALSGQFFSDERWKNKIKLSLEAKFRLEALAYQKRGVMLLIPHTTLMEALTVLPAMISHRQEVSVLYRAFASAEIEKKVLARRSAHGLKLLNRSSGMRTLVRELKAGQVGGLLFDQNSGEKGELISFMGRLAAASDLPDVIYRHARPLPVVIAIKRTGFWRGEIVVKALREGENELPLTIQAHRWLEGYLKDPKTSTDWLWMHKRWKVQDRPAERLGLGNRSVMELPTQKKTKIFVRMPNWLGDIVMALPMLRALRQSRPDAEISYLCRSPYIPLLKLFGLADRILGLPKKPFKSFAFCAALKKEFPDVSIALTNSFRGDIELFMTGARMRFGLVCPGKWRPLITHGYHVDAKTLESSHQSHVWESMFKYFGCSVPVSYEPFNVLESQGQQALQGIGRVKEPRSLGFVTGSANTPQKRYPANLWRSLAEKLQQPIVLFGTATEQPITTQIAKDLSFVTDLAGKTEMNGLALRIAECKVMIGNDTGAMHLANAVGVPTLVIYGPTSPTRTKPIFNAPYTQIKAENGVIGSITPDEVYAVIKEKNFI